MIFEKTFNRLADKYIQRQVESLKANKEQLMEMAKPIITEMLNDVIADYVKEIQKNPGQLQAMMPQDGKQMMPNIAMTLLSKKKLTITDLAPLALQFMFNKKGGGGSAQSSGKSPFE